MKTRGIKTVALAELKANLFVRKQLDQDRVLYLAELIENGIEMTDPIEVTPELAIVDGRHRQEAYELNNRTEVQVRILEFEDDSEMIAYAYKKNLGGALPPSQQDAEHTVMLLLEHGNSMKRIGELLGLPPGLARRYVYEVRSKAARAKLLKASAAVTDGGYTLAKAAQEYDVDPDKLKEVMSGHRKKHKQGVAEIQRTLTANHRSLSQKNAGLFKSLRDKYEDGDVTKAQITAIFEHIKKLQKRANRALADWENRFGVKTVDTSTAKKAQ